jgi:hemerythrin-like domain-containing protein
MTPTQILNAEHRVILRVLACLERIREQAVAQGHLDGDSAAEAIAFFREFADRCHHGKEERHLFGLMERRGVPLAGGPIGVMLSEHDLGREQVRGMDAALSGASQGQPDALRGFAEHARLYVELLRAHIAKEDGILFPMADQVLSPQDQHELGAAFARVEREEMGDGVHEAFHAAADRLGDRYGVPELMTAEEECDGCAHSCRA